MSRRKQQRESANPHEQATQTTNEKILKDCYDLYTSQDHGLVKCAEELGLTVLVPRRKITVLLIGNHSAGKSSFINWYIEEHVLKTGVAIETQGFAFVTSGKKRESLTGNATLKLYPHFKELEKLEGVVNYLTTEVSTSRQKKFGMVVFVDTPGLVDGDMKYPFNVDDSIVWLGGLADLIFVFFDPMGQALCRRTLNVVERLNEKYTDRIKFYLSKSDTAGTETDRQKVMVQITQELCKRPGLNRAGFEMPTIFVPSLTEKQPRCENQIDELCQEVEKTINQAVQTTLNTLEKDCNTITQEIDRRLDQDRQRVSTNCCGLVKGYFLGLASFCLLQLLIVVTVNKDTLTTIIRQFLGEEGTLVMKELIAQTQAVWQLLPSTYSLVVLTVLILVFLYLASVTVRSKPTLSRREKKDLLARKEHIIKNVRPVKERLYQNYLKQSISAADLY
ncbi:uncharacterized protein [Dysidea avara]|uniref:uncharacterized protein n=1 Tax=Dysidea avara TaxID=196820 RepID=UPI003326ECD5